jgi:hypothetical protein
MLRRSVDERAFVFMNNSAIRQVTDARPKKIRSAVTNGRRSFVSDGDGRSPWMRRRRDLEMIYAEDLGGRDSLSGYQMGLVEAAATIRVELERMEARLSSGEVVDVEVYARVASHYRRIAESLGIERKARNIPSISEYLARKEAERIKA